MPIKKAPKKVSEKRKKQDIEKPTPSPRGRKKKVSSPETLDIPAVPVTEDQVSYDDQALFSDQPSDPENDTPATGDRNARNVFFVFAGVIVVLLLAFFLFSQKKTVPVSETAECKLPDQQVDTTRTVKAGDAIEVDYIGKLEDGTIFDSSIEPCFKQSENYKPGEQRPFKPLPFVVGQGMMIKGFDQGVEGMKVGEKKKITIPPELGYGQKDYQVPTRYFKDVFEETTKLENFNDTIVKQVPKEMLGGRQFKVNEDLPIGLGVTAKVTAVYETGITISYENKENPFYGTKLKVGLKNDSTGSTLEIKEITKDSVTLIVTNKSNPFKGKKLEIGMIGTLPTGQEIRILKIGDEMTTVELLNGHKLAGKTLIFEVLVRNIK